MKHQEWLEWRRQGLGASDAPILMGVSPWTTRFQLWEEKVFSKVSRQDNKAMEIGREREEEARRAFEEKFNVSVFPKNVVHPEYSWLRASLDGIDVDGKILVEIKNPSKEDHEVALGNKIPEKYYPQLQHQLLVTPLDEGYYWSYHNKKGKDVLVPFNNDYVNNYILIAHEFWHKNVLEKIPPDLSEMDYIRMEDEPKWLKLCRRRQNNREDRKLLEQEDEELLAEIIELIGNRNAQGHGFKMTKSLRKGNLDMQRLMQDYPELPWEKYRKESSIVWNLNKIDP